MGACAANGQTVCEGGEVIDICQEGAPNGVDDNCDLVDNDCDGKVDESYDPDDHQVTCQNMLALGQGTSFARTQDLKHLRVVENGDLVDDSCDGVNQDCDSAVDEHYQPPSNGSVISCGVGACRNDAGILDCVDGSVLTICTPNDPIGDDSNCDGVDDDCDGSIDEAFNESTSCGVGECARTVADSCINGQRQNNCVPGDPADFDRCGNESDDDCDGSIYDYGLQEPCTVNNNFCINTGVNQCNAELNDVVCSAEVPEPEPESCDGVDNDCDNAVDEDVEYSQQGCETSEEGILGLCQQGSLTCLGGFDYCEPSLPLTKSLALGKMKIAMALSTKSSLKVN